MFVKLMDLHRTSKQTSASKYSNAKKPKRSFIPEKLSKTRQYLGLVFPLVAVNIVNSSPANHIRLTIQLYQELISKS